MNPIQITEIVYKIKVDFKDRPQAFSQFVQEKLMEWKSVEWLDHPIDDRYSEYTVTFKHPRYDVNEH